MNYYTPLILYFWVCKCMLTDGRLEDGIDDEVEEWGKCDHIR